jgi:hypothetical protein
MLLTLLLLPLRAGCVGAALGETVIKQLLRGGALDVEKYLGSAPKTYACPKQQQGADHGPMEGAAAFLW